MFIGNPSCYTNDDLTVGDHVTVECWTGGSRHGILTDIHEEVKNDRPGISYTGLDGETWWAYTDQVIMVSTPT